MKHVASLDGLRALSILLVLSAHTLALGPARFEANEMAARMGMALFFCLSGHLITSTLLARPAVWPFLVKRVFRIVPSLWLYLTLLVLFFGVRWNHALLDALFVSNYFVAGLDDGPTAHLWSLCVEMQFYVAVSLLVWVAGVRGLWLLPLAMLAVTGLRIDATAHASINTHLRVDEILAGATLALVLHRWGDRAKAQLGTARGAAPALLVLAVLWMVSSHPQAGPANYLRPYLTASVVGLILVAAPTGLKRLLESRPAAYVARISYALYIYHPMMIWGFMNQGSSLVRYLVKRPISWALTFAAAHASTFLWEVKWQRFARQRILGERPEQ